jgi:hypothetical protein
VKFHFKNFIAENRSSCSKGWSDVSEVEGKRRSAQLKISTRWLLWCGHRKLPEKGKPTIEPT